MLMNLFKFKGGVKPPTNKTQSVGLPIAIAPLPSRLVVPLHRDCAFEPPLGDRVREEMSHLYPIGVGGLHR